MRFLQSIGCLTPVAILFYGVAGMFLLGQFGGEAVDYLRTMGWEQVPGTVTYSEVEDVWDTTGDRYAAHIIYTYEVAGESYEGEQLSLRDSSNLANEEDAAARLEPYPVNTSVMVYFNPDDPVNAVLDRDLPGAIWGFVGVGGVLLLLSLSLGVRHVLTRQQAPEPASG